MSLREAYPFPGVESPFDHQVETVEFMLRNNIGYILDEMGTGKTLSSLWATDILFLHDKIQTGVLIVAPLSTLDFVWAKELRTRMPHRKFQILHGSKKERLYRLSQPAHYYIINHDGIKTITDQLVARKFDAVIIDELTAFKNAQSQRTRAMQKIVRHIHTQKKRRGLWGMTGSPTANSPLDAFGQAKVITPHSLKQFGGYWTYFRDAVMIQLDMYNYVPRPGWQQVVASVLSPSVRHKLRDCVDLPETLYEERSIPMSAEQKRMYKEMKELFLTQYQNGEISASNAGVKALKLLQISAGCIYDEDRNYNFIDNKPKLNELYTIFEESGRDKLLVFSTFKASIIQIEEFLRKKGVRVNSVYGGLSKNKRTEIYNDFQDGDLEVLVAQPATSSHGLTLVASRHIVWFTPVPSNEVHKQANARIVRPGQERTQIITRMHSSPAERRTYKALDGKESMSKALLDLLSSP
ncbi:MAG: DEAD/DEAH box helicase [Acidimicrobiia bacterium]|nr:DEAD/DEAH box helicase [Acidimicrobiia bacterium]